MRPSRGPCDARFQLIQAANHFLFSVLPLRREDSRQALNLFVGAAGACELASADVDAILVRALAVLNPQARGRLPGLVDRYLAANDRRPGDVAGFRRCVEDLLCFCGVEHPDVEAAIRFLESHYKEPDLAPSAVAAHLNIDVSEVQKSFHVVTGVTIPAYLRGVRLDRAAHALVSSCASVKEIWAGVGYNHAANFDHEFKNRFGMSPREYRLRCREVRCRVRPVESPESTGQTAGRDDPANILIVDDDPVLCDLTRQFLTASGYVVDTVALGGDCLRLAASRVFDAMLVDYRLPDLDGVDLLRALRQAPSGSRTAVALFTADWNIDQRAEEIRGLGAVIASKLCDLEELRRLVDSLCAMPLASRLPNLQTTRG